MNEGHDTGGEKSRPILVSKRSEAAAERQEAVAWDDIKKVNKECIQDFIILS